MKKSKEWLLGALFGLIPAALLLFGTEYLLRNLSSIAASVMPMLDIPMSEAENYIMVLDQLRDAEICMPIPAVLLICCCAAALTAKFLSEATKKNPRIALAVVLWIICLPLLFVLTLLFTEVNTILFGTVLRSLAAFL